MTGSDRKSKSAAIKDPMDAHIAVAQADAAKLQARWTAWLAEDTRRREQGLVDTNEHLVEGVEALMPIAQQFSESVRMFDLGISITDELLKSAQREIDDLTAKSGDTAQVNARVEHLSSHKAQLVDWRAKAAEFLEKIKSDSNVLDQRFADANAVRSGFVLHPGGGRPN